MRTRLFVLIAVSLFMQSCSSSKEESYTAETESYQTFIQGMPVSSTQHEYIIIIPISNGCESCVMKTVDFMKSHADDKRFVYVLSTSSQAFLLQNKLISKSEIEMMEQKGRLGVDTKNEAFMLGLIETFPVLYKVSDKKIVSKQQIDASTAENVLGGLQ